ncbi:HutP family protein [Clostridium chauvoei]|uniref:Hut operon positive regulatory protein n=2 Tax=Clostridium chauvoei TaxID=46867 RepID=S6F8Z7_9CLOT|nr:HutP family protein [Clostridium chauvoei]ATD54867.1 hut operon positive regulator HutP [Clostridium chauvoei]ATD57454.1 hut operon positive regulator HutP [Clostridium chauvoei]MBX7280521.1 HutP family protein [Clostridium chauvoei]MBX7283006.1 HutP family protein [Clostridium chauvoei]MBX7285523.1 HutP family protein [Clostridium chauvoei]
MRNNSLEVAKIATKMAISTREEEEKLKIDLKKEGFLVTAVNIGGNINESTSKILERALVASKRNDVIREEHLHEGGIIGATRDALMQIWDRASGQNVGGKIGIARKGEHLSVCIFLSIGLLHLDEVVIGIGHRAVPM